MNFLRTIPFVLAAIFTSGVITGCNSSVTDDIEDAIDLADGVPRKDIDQSKIGVNAFFNNSSFGSTQEQYAEIRNTLGVRYVRALIAWNDAVQPSPESEPNFGLYDEVLNNIPQGVDVLVILTDVPSWMADPGNWSGGNPRQTFSDRWVRRVVNRYRNRSGIIGFQIWNEPNMPDRRDNEILQLTTSPVNFLELLAFSSDVVKSIRPGAFVLNGATTAINQNYPGTIQYNRELRDGGVANFVDVFAAHYYGRQFENVLRDGGVADVLNSIPRRIWLTESGAQGVNEQLAYGEQVWPFLVDNIPSIDRIYVYQMYEATPPDITYGLRNLSSTPLSDLYIHLRDF